MIRRVVWKGVDDQTGHVERICQCGTWRRVEFQNTVDTGTQKKGKVIVEWKASLPPYVRPSFPPSCTTSLPPSLAPYHPPSLITYTSFLLTATRT